MTILWLSKVSFTDGTYVEIDTDDVDAIQAMSFGVRVTKNDRTIIHPWHKVHSAIEESSE